jgi:hypothetical protein
VSTTKAFLSKADQAITSSEIELTSILRDHLLASGWTYEAALSVSIVYTGERFDYKFEGASTQEAETLEFGSEEMRPTAAVRKFLNKTNVIEQVYVAQLERQLGELV